MVPDGVHVGVRGWEINQYQSSSIRADLLSAPPFSPSPSANWTEVTAALCFSIFSVIASSLGRESGGKERFRPSVFVFLRTPVSLYSRCLLETFEKRRFAAVKATQISLDFGFREFQDCSRLFSRLNEAEIVLTFFGKEKKKKRKKVLLKRHVWTRRAHMEADLHSLQIFFRGYLPTADPGLARLPHMCPKFRGGKTGRGKAPPCLDPSLLSLFLLKPDGPGQTEPPP